MDMCVLVEWAMVLTPVIVTIIFLVIGYGIRETAAIFLIFLLCILIAVLTSKGIALIQGNLP